MKEMPLIDETVAAEDDLLKSFGGKGANQCICAARLSSLNPNTKVEMLGQVGNDFEGKSYIKFLKENDVKIDNVNVLDDKATGQAFILSI